MVFKIYSASVHWRFGSSPAPSPRQLLFKRLSHTALRSDKPCSRQLQRQESLDLLPASEQRQPSALRAVWPASLEARPRQEPPHSSEQLKPLLAAALIRRLEILSVRWAVRGRRRDRGASQRRMILLATTLFVKF